MTTATPVFADLGNRVRLDGHRYAYEYYCEAYGYGVPGCHGSTKRSHRWTTVGNKGGWTVSYGLTERPGLRQNTGRFSHPEDWVPDLTVVIVLCPHCSKGKP